jgi:hypothetical protein
MAQGKGFQPEVRALAEALYRSGHETREVREIVRRVTGEAPSDPTLRVWRSKMAARTTDDGSKVYAELAKRMTPAKLSEGFGVAWDLIERRAELPHLGTDQFIRLAALKILARLYGWSDFDAMADSVAYQWEVTARLREKMPVESDQVLQPLAYLLTVHRQVNIEALNRAFTLLKENPALGVLAQAPGGGQAATAKAGQSSHTHSKERQS